MSNNQWIIGLLLYTSWICAIFILISSSVTIANTVAYNTQNLPSYIDTSFDTTLVIDTTFSLQNDTTNNNFVYGDKNFTLLLDIISDNKNPIETRIVFLRFLSSNYYIEGEKAERKLFEILNDSTEDHTLQLEIAWGFMYDGVFSITVTRALRRIWRTSSSDEEKWKAAYYLVCHETWTNEILATLLEHSYTSADEDKIWLAGNAISYAPPHVIAQIIDAIQTAQQQADSMRTRNLIGMIILLASKVEEQQASEIQKLLIPMLTDKSYPPSTRHKAMRVVANMGQLASNSISTLAGIARSPHQYLFDDNTYYEDPEKIDFQSEAIEILYEIGLPALDTLWAIALDSSIVLPIRNNAMTKAVYLDPTNVETARIIDSVLEANISLLQSPIEVTPHHYALTSHFAGLVGELGQNGYQSLSKLVLIGKDPKIKLNNETRSAFNTYDAKQAIVKLAQYAQKNHLVSRIPELKSSLDSLEQSFKSKKNYYPFYDKEIILQITLSIEALESYQQARFLSVFLDVNPFVWWLMGYLLWLGLCVLFVYIFPITSHRITGKLVEFIPSKLSDQTSTISVLFLSFILPVIGLRYSQRVLTAWTRHHQTIARQRYDTIRTVSERNIHIPVAVANEDGEEMAFTPLTFQTIFERGQNRVAIVGEGGIGKTSIVVELGRWIMEKNTQFSLKKSKPMIAVLIEESSLTPILIGGGELLDYIQIELSHYINSSTNIERKFLKRLLTRGHIVLIVDGLSEMESKTLDSVKNLCIQIPSLPILSTSRISINLDSRIPTQIKPKRLAASSLTEFINEYLEKSLKRKLFSNNEFMIAALHLTKVAGEHDITPLMVRLFIDQEIAYKEGVDRLPVGDSKADIVMNYVNVINRSATEKGLSNSQVQIAGQIIAWECVKQGFLPVAVPREIIEKALMRDDPVSHQLAKTLDETELILTYLEKKLALLQLLGPTKRMVRFSLDPIAEYLAAFYCTRLYNTKESDWKEFLNRMVKVPGAPQSISGFISALLDSIKSEACAIEVPHHVVTALKTISKRDSITP